MKTSHPTPGVHPPGVLPDYTPRLPTPTDFPALLASDSNAAQYKAAMEDFPLFSDSIAASEVV